MTEDEYEAELEELAYVAWKNNQETGADTSREAYADWTVARAEAWIDQESGRWGVRS